MSSSLAPVETPELFFPHVVNNDRSSIVSNIKTNSERGLPELEQADSVDTPLVIAAGGPSLLTRLPILKALLVDSHLMTINGAYKYMMNRGIKCVYATNVRHAPCAKSCRKFTSDFRIFCDIFLVVSYMILVLLSNREH